MIRIIVFKLPASTDQMQVFEPVKVVEYDFLMFVEINLK